MTARPCDSRSRDTDTGDPSYYLRMFNFGSAAAQTAPQFVPDENSRDWIASALRDVIAALGPPAMAPRRVADPPARGVARPRDLDSLFDFICAAQEHIGQDDLEFTLLEHTPTQSMPDGFKPVGDAQGHMIHTFRRGKDELVLLVMPAVFRAPQLVLGSVARELGRMGLLQREGFLDPIKSLDDEAAAELAGVALGMGVWIANGAYMFENACCGGGCGLDLRSFRVNLSLPEVCFALALDARRKGFSRRQIARLLEPTQKSAFKKSWSAAPDKLAALPGPASRAALRG